MNKFLRRTWAEISLDHIAYNYNQIRRRLSNECKLMAVVKADAYGHGAVSIAKLMYMLGADYLAVATIEEAIELRAAGNTLPILIFGYTNPEMTDRLLAYQLTQTVQDACEARMFSSASTSLGQLLKVHIKVDTGMTRLGMIYHNEEDEYDTLSQIREINKLPGLYIEGIYTHFANADIKSDTFTHLQFMRFMSLVDRLDKTGIHITIKHCANSSTLINYPEMHLNMVRPGIILYGCYPTEEMQVDIELHKAMSVYSVISQIKSIKEGVPVSYGCKFKAKKDTRVAVVEIGYADGLMRNLSQVGHMIVNGIICPIIGTICMDRCMVDVTEVDSVHSGDIVTVLGSVGEATITAESQAKLAGTISHDILCSVSKRVPRVYR